MIEENIDYFAVFGIKRSFFIDNDELTAKYLLAQKENHPDNASSANEDSSVSSSMINMAYKVLNDPISRAEHLLNLLGKKIECSSSVSMKMFEIRNKYSLCKNIDEKKKVYNEISQYLEKNIKLLDDIDYEDGKFTDVVCFCRFLRSFLEKVESDVYNWN